MGEKSVSTLKANPKNPRKITPQKLEQLEKSMREFGDLSGIVFNVKTGNLVGGHQRTKRFSEDSKVVITKHFEKPTRSGTKKAVLQKTITRKIPAKRL